MNVRDSGRTELARERALKRERERERERESWGGGKEEGREREDTERKIT